MSPKYKNKPTQSSSLLTPFLTIKKPCKTECVKDTAHHWKASPKTKTFFLRVLTLHFYYSSAKHWDYRCAAMPLLCGFWKSELRSSYLYIKHCIDWAVFPVPGFLFSHICLSVLCSHTNILQKGQIFLMTTAGRKKRENHLHFFKFSNFLFCFLR